MTPRNPSSGKKPRWSAAKKATARGAQRPPSSSAGRPTRFDRADRRAAAPAFERGERDDRGQRSGSWRDERPHRSGERSGSSGHVRDDRRSGGFSRDDKPRYGGGDRPRYERSDRPRYERSDRPRYERDDRPRSERSDRPRFDRDDRRSGAPSRDDRSQAGYSRDDRRFGGERSGGFGRDDRRFGGDRPGGPDRRDRSDRSERFGRDDRRSGSYARDDRRFGGDRPGGFSADDRPRFERSDRPRFERSDRPRYERSDRPRFERDDRPRYERSDRPRFERDDRPRYERSDRPRFERGEGAERRPAQRFEERRPERRFEPGRSERAEHTDRAERRPDPYAERLRQVERPIVEPVPVTDDNAFLALGVPSDLVKRLARDGIAEPFPIQTATIPDALAGRDVLGRGRTGSGKTLAFGLPLIARLAGGTPQPRRPRALVLVPTRELAMQVSDALQPLVHVMGLRHKLVAGGMPYPPQFEALDRGVDVLIATPGRLADLVEREAAILDAVEVVVLDEADHMAEMGFLEAVSELLDLVPEGGQRLLFSATLDRGVDGLVEKYLTDPVTHSTDDGTASVTTMDHHILLVEPNHKKLITADVANRQGRTVVFVRTKLGADRVAMQLREQGVFAAALHGGLNQGQRNRVLSAFKEGQLPVLVATDVAARGIHVDDVSVVLQVDPPADHKDYLHRAGRTARAGEAGTVVTLALPHQRKMMERIAREAGIAAEPVRVRVGDDTILDATGAQRPSGVPIPEERLRKLLEPPRRPAGRRYGGRGFGGGGGRGFGGGSRSGGRPYRGGGAAG